MLVNTFYLKILNYISYFGYAVCWTYVIIRISDGYYHLYRTKDLWIWTHWTDKWLKFRIIEQSPPDSLPLSKLVILCGILAFSDIPQFMKLGTFSIPLSTCFKLFRPNIFLKSSFLYFVPVFNYYVFFPSTFFLENSLPYIELRAWASYRIEPFFK